MKQIKSWPPNPFTASTLTCAWGLSGLPPALLWCTLHTAAGETVLQQKSDPSPKCSKPSDGIALPLCWIPQSIKGLQDPAAHTSHPIPCRCHTGLLLLLKHSKLTPASESLPQTLCTCCSEISVQLTPSCQLGVSSTVTSSERASPDHAI